MKDLALERERMNRFFETVADDELVTILRELDWEHYAAISVPILMPQYSVSIKRLPAPPLKAWSVRHRSVINMTPAQDRLAA